MDEPHYWFRRKRFGWGLEPGSLEGWIATIVFFVASVGSVFGLIFLRARPPIPVVWAAVCIVAFVAVVIAKGEKFW
jgi:hypothetical protein